MNALHRVTSRWCFGSAVVIAAAVLSGLLIYQRHLAGQAVTRRDPNGRPVPVQVAAAADAGNVDVTIDSLGTVTAINAVTVRSQVDGQLIHVDFHEGQIVKAGDRLVETDPGPCQL